MRALLLRYVVMMQARPEKAIQPSIGFWTGLKDVWLLRYDVQHDMP